MERAKKTIVIIKDDFKNVLLLQKKVKRTEPKVWYLIDGEVKGKGTEEKAVDKMIKKSINSILFNKEVFKEYKIDDSDDILRVYTGQLKERIVLHKDYTQSKWIGLRDLDGLDIDEKHLEILKEFMGV